MGLNAFGIPNQFQNVTAVPDQKGLGLDASFLWLRHSLPSFLQPIRPYSLKTNPDDHQNLAEPRHRRPSRLLRLLGASFDPFWMSIEQPPEAPAAHGDGQLLQVRTTDLLPPQVTTSIQSLLVHFATCELSYQWKDLGPAFWPRWLRQTDCGSSDRGGSCSFPSGMEYASKKTRSAWSNGSREVGTGGALRRCLWRQVSYPVVTACKCSCT
uniref:Noggin-1-like n=1 Tax=Cynoglossus semilaevis TaxID=244447 RepID=A0A3P8W6N0_CYNSE